MRLAIALLAAGALPLAAAPQPNIRLFLQLVELPHPALTELMAAPDTTGAALRAKALALVKTGEAKVLESVVLTTSNGHAVKGESVREMIYATEYEPLGIPLHVAYGLREAQADIRRELFEAHGPYAYRTPTAWDTRNVGVSVEATPALAEAAQSISLSFIAEFHAPEDFVTFNDWLGPYGHYDIRMPHFKARRVTTSLTLAPGVFELAAVLSPPAGLPTPAMARKVLVFVKCEVVR
jgi:hypothetical protein